MFFFPNHCIKINEKASAPFTTPSKAWNTFTLNSWQTSPLIVTHLAIWAIATESCWVWTKGQQFKKKKKKKHLVQFCKRIWVTLAGILCINSIIYLHKLKRSLKILHGIHFNPKELHAHDETDNALDYVRTLLFLPELLQFCDELLPHCLEPEHRGRDILALTKTLLTRVCRR